MRWIDFVSGRLSWWSCLLLLVAMSAPLFAVGGAVAQEPCGPPNVVPVNTCNFENWSGTPPREMAEGWSPFVLSGEVEYANDPHSYFGGGTLRMRNSGGTFKAGIYTTVSVTPGAGYKASVWWGAPNDPANFGRQLGLDPTGGTDPNSPSIIWGPVYFGDGRFLNYPPGEGPNIDVLGRAFGDRMTIFFLVDHPASTGDNLIYIDVITLVPDENAPQLPAPTPTPEPTPLPPPTPAPTVFVPAVEAAPTEPPATNTPLPTETPTPAPTFTPTHTPSPTATPTVTPTWTPWPTAEPPPLLEMVLEGDGGGSQARSVALPFRAGDEPVTADAGVVRAGLAAFGVLSLLGAVLFGASLARMRRRRN